MRFGDNLAALLLFVAIFAAILVVAGVGARFGMTVERRLRKTGATRIESRRDARGIHEIWLAVVSQYNSLQRQQRHDRRVSHWPKDPDFIPPWMLESEPTPQHLLEYQFPKLIQLTDIGLLRRQAD